MNPNQAEVRPGLTGVMRVLGILAVMVAALIGALAVLGLIPQEALQEWFTKAGLTLVIVVGAAVAIALIARSGPKS